MDLVRVLQADARIGAMNAEQDTYDGVPTYDPLAVQRMNALFSPVIPYHPFTLGNDLRATFFPAGHIIGACSILLESSEGQ